MGGPHARGGCASLARLVARHHHSPSIAIRQCGQANPRSYLSLASPPSPQTADNAHWSALSLGPLGQPDDHRVSVKCASLPIDALERLFVSAVDATAIPITTATTAVDFYSDPGGADDGGDSGAVSGVAAQVPHLSLTAPSTMSNTNTNGDEQKQHQAQAQAQPPTTAAAATGGAAAGLVVPHAPPRESGHSGHNMPMRPQEGQQARGGSAACAVS